MRKLNKMLHTKAEVVRSAGQPDGVIEAVIGSSNAVDRMGEVIDQAGWVLDNYLKNPVILWGHNVREERPPIGRALKVWVEGAQRKTKKLMFTVQFDLLDSFAAEIYRKVKDGFVNTVSVGFMPLEIDDNTYTKAELLELSFVPIPANPEAVVTLRSMGIEPIEMKDIYALEEKEAKLSKKKDANAEEVTEEKVEEKVEDKKEDEVVVTDDKKEVVEEKPEEKVEKPAEEEKVEEKKEELETKDETKVEDKKEEVEEESKSVLPYKAMGVAPESEDWDAGAEVKKADIEVLKLISAWFNSEEPENKSSYKLQHHKADGEHVAVWRGVATSMAMLLGAKEMNDIPESDRKAVYNHLAKHYKEFDKEVPEYRAVEDQVLKTYREEIHALMLEREEKHTVRLIKKVLQTMKKKEVKKEVKVEEKRTPNEAELKAALQVLDIALSNVFKSSPEGGDK